MAEMEASYQADWETIIKVGGGVVEFQHYFDGARADCPFPFPTILDSFISSKQRNGEGF